MSARPGTSRQTGMVGDKGVKGDKTSDQRKIGDLAYIAMEAERVH